MEINDRQKALLDGDGGEARQMAMELILTPLVHDMVQKSRKKKK